jgi:hypothetical protein
VWNADNLAPLSLSLSLSLRAEPRIGEIIAHVARCNNKDSRHASANPNAHIQLTFHPKPKHSRLGAKGPPLVGEEVRKRVGT